MNHLQMTRRVLEVRNLTEFIYGDKELGHVNSDETGQYGLVTR